MVSARVRREQVAYVQTRGLSRRRACALLSVARSTIGYQSRLVVLQSAWKSARESTDFEEPQRLFESIRKLATDYWHAMVDGKGDLEARQAFGNAYAARESETVESNVQARKLRTFDYNGESILMLRHLKIGRKDSSFKTIRLHFHWDAKLNRVVIGHCGPHLDFD